LAGLVLISYLGAFGGGKHIIPFGWDFLVIGIFSIVFLYIAVRNRSTVLSQNFVAYQQSLALAADIG
jgi:hypothetical protein